MDNLAKKLERILTLSMLRDSIHRIRQQNVVRGLKDIKKIKRNSTFDSINSGASGNTSNRQSYDTRNTNHNLQSQYTTIKPLENLYTSVKIINGEKHNLESEKQNKNKMKLAETDQKIDPQKFLQKWMTCGSKQILTVQNYPQSDLSFRPIESYGQQALKVIDESPFLKFLDGILRKKQMWQPAIGTLCHRKDSLTSSMTYLLPQFEEKALQMFDLLLKCENLKHTQKPYYYTAAELIHFVLQNESEQLKQELYLQVIKQLSSRRIIYLRLLALCSCFIKPSLRMYIPLLNYLKREQQQYPLLKEYYNFCFYQLIKNFDSPRKNCCTIFQAQLVMHLRKIPILFDLPTPKTFFVETHTTIKEFFEVVIDFYNLDENVEYLLFYRTTLFKEGILMDCLTKIELQKNLIQAYETFTGFKVLIVLKNMRRMKTSSKCYNIMYHYFVQQHLKNFYFLGKDENIRIGALKLYSQLEDDDTSTIDIQQLIPRSFYRRFISQAHDPKDAQMQIIKKIFNQFDKLKGKQRLETRKQILSIIRKRQNYMTHFVRGRIYFNKDPEDYEAVMGIKPTKILLIDYLSGRYIRKITFDKIVRWGKTSTEFCLVVDNVGQIHFETDNARLAADIFEQYVNELVKG